MFLSEAEQISQIDEAESVPSTPFAFSFTEEQIDHVLRLGSNTDEHRKLVAAEYMKQKPIEDIAERLSKIYHGGNGFQVNGQDISDEDLAAVTEYVQPLAQAMEDLRDFMFKKVYRNPVAKGEESKAKDMLSRLFEYYITHPEALPEDFQPQLSFDGMERTVCDYIAGMTDNYAVDKYTQIFIPTGWEVRG